MVAQAVEAVAEAAGALKSRVMSATCTPTLKLLLVNCNVATMAEDAQGGVAARGAFGLIKDGVVGIAPDGTVALVCARAELPTGAETSAYEVRDMKRCLVTPGLIDCHTHLVYGGAQARVREWELKLGGASYEDLAKSGGGIAATVEGTRAASMQELAEEASPRVMALMRDGVTTLEIKSGYGLDHDTERRQLEAAGELGANHGCKVVCTYLGAHGLPAEYQGRANDYIEQVVGPTMKSLDGAGLIDAVDAFCEHIAFSSEQTAKVFAQARELGLPVRLHGDQLSDQGSAELAAKHGALSCDHCEHTSETGVAAMAQAGTVAVLLPASNLFMNESKLPPVDAFRKAGVRMAIATNCNPGSSPCCSMLLAMSLACSRFRLTPEEALLGATRHAAAAIGRLDSLGSLEAGKAADVACWSCSTPAELCYSMGLPQLITSFVDGQETAVSLGLSMPQCSGAPSAARKQPRAFQRRRSSVPAYPVQGVRPSTPNGSPRPSSSPTLAAKSGPHPSVPSNQLLS